MNIARRDMLFIAVILIVATVLYLGTRKKLGPPVPGTRIHLVFYQQLQQGGRRVEVEHGCRGCHPIKKLPPAHPHKEECMVCHRPAPPKGQ